MAAGELFLARSDSEDYYGYLADKLMHSMLLVFSGVFTFLVDAYPLYAASALAANSFARSSFAAAFPLFGNQSKFEATIPLHNHYAPWCR